MFIFELHFRNHQPGIIASEDINFPQVLLMGDQVAGFISKITTLLIIWWGAHLVIAGALTVGQLVAFNMIAGRVTAPILKLVQLWQDFQQAGISLKRLGDILNTPAETGFNPNRSTPKQLQGAVTFERLRFRYRPDGPCVLVALGFRDV